MAQALSKLAGAVRSDGAAPTWTDWLRALGPWVAPLVIAVCGARADALAPVALIWMALLIPGMLALNLWFPAGHPLSSGAARLGVASVLTLAPFALFAYAGCVLHWRLTTVMALYAVACVLMVGLLGRTLLRKPIQAEQPPACPGFELPVLAPRWAACVVLVGIAVMLAGVCLAAPNTHVPDVEFSNPAARPGWWRGAVMGACAALLAAVALALGLRPASEAADAAGAQGAPTRKEAEDRGRASGRGRRGRGQSPSLTDSAERWMVAVIWLACGVLTLHLMRATYSVSLPKMEQLERTLPWDVDDVAYVSEAVDYRHGLEMGRYDPSLGGDYSLPRVRMSPLFAPLVAMISRLTGVECAALHHSVMPPLVVLVGVSCYAAVLLVVFQKHRWLTPIGLLIVLMLVYKSWDFPRCEVEMMIYRAMQGKALHLWWPLPLQIVSMVLLARTPNWRHFGLAGATALVGHMTHPLATIMGMLFGAAAIVVALIDRRGALGKLIVLLVLHAALAGEFYVAGHLNRDLPGVASDRVANEPLETRDLVRVDALRFSIGREFESDLTGGVVTQTLSKAFGDHEIAVPAGVSIAWNEAGGYHVIGADRRGGYRVIPRDDRFEVYQIDGDAIARHDPFWTFGCNSLYLAGALAVPVVLVLGWRRRELLYIGALGAAVLICTNFEPLGRILSVALPMSIFWRARWMLPALVNLAAIGAVVYWAVLVLVRSRDGRTDMGRRLFACTAAVAGFILYVANTDSRSVVVGAAPPRLTKFSPDTHELVEKLGGVEAKPFVWGTFLVHHELPQLMPNVQLVFSRTKFMRPADDPAFRTVAERIFDGYPRGLVEPALYDRLLATYPIDHMIVDRGYAKGAELLTEYLKGRGWRLTGRTARRYEVWQGPATTAAESPGP